MQRLLLTLIDPAYKNSIKANLSGDEDTLGFYRHKGSIWLAQVFPEESLNSYDIKISDGNLDQIWMTQEQINLSVESL